MAYEILVYPKSMAAAADLSSDQYRFVKIDTNGRIALCGSGGNGIGVLQDKPNALDQPGSVCRPGDITRVVYGGAVPKGSLVMSDGNGKAVVATSGSYVLGQNLDQIGADTEVGAILFQPIGKL